MTRNEAIREARAQATYKRTAHIVVRHRMSPSRWSRGGWTWRVYPVTCDAAQEILPNDPDNLIILTTQGG